MECLEQNVTYLFCWSNVSELGYPRKFYGYGYGWQISYPRQASIYRCCYYTLSAVAQMAVKPSAVSEWYCRGRGSNASSLFIVMIELLCNSVCYNVEDLLHHRRCIRALNHMELWTWSGFLASYYPHTSLAHFNVQI